MNNPGLRKSFGLVSSAILIILITSVVAFAIGRIEGRITDSETGEPLPGVNIIIKGTYLGAATDLDGRFIIAGVKPGSYDLQASFIGYKVSIQTDVRLKEDDIVTVDFKLEPTVLEPELHQPTHIAVRYLKPYSFPGLLVQQQRTVPCSLSSERP